MRKHAIARMVWGNAPQEDAQNLVAMRLLLRAFLGQNNASRWPDEEFHMHEYPSTFPAHRTQWHWFQLPDRLLSCKSHLWKNEKLLRGRLRRDSFTLFAAISQVLACQIQMLACGPCMGVQRAICWQWQVSLE